MKSVGAVHTLVVASLRGSVEGVCSLAWWVHDFGRWPPGEDRYRWWGGDPFDWRGIQVAGYGGLFHCTKGWVQYLHYTWAWTVGWVQKRAWVRVFRWTLLRVSLGHVGVCLAAKSIIRSSEGGRDSKMDKTVHVGSVCSSAAQFQQKWRERVYTSPTLALFSVACSLQFIPFGPPPPSSMKLGVHRKRSEVTKLDSEIEVTESKEGIRWCCPAQSFLEWMFSLLMYLCKGTFGFHSVCKEALTML